jgi:hypothetical protein
MVKRQFQVVPGNLGNGKSPIDYRLQMVFQYIVLSTVTF